MSADGGPLPTAGLRARLVRGFVAVGLVSGAVTALTAVVGALVLVAADSPRAAAVGARLRELPGLAALAGTGPAGLAVVLVAAGAVLLLVPAVVGWLSAGRVLRPVGRLAAAAERVAAGDLGVRLVPEGDDELARLAHRFNTMTAMLRRRVEELADHEARARRFAADVSHELRTPLAAMTAVTEVLADETAGMTPKAAQASRIVVAEIAALDRLVDDLMEMSRFDAGTARLQAEPVDVAALVGACLERRGWTADVDVRVPAGLVVGLDRRRADVVLANLVGNAVRHGAPPVEVAAWRAGGSLVVEVRDRGPGIPDAVLPHVFDRFVKGDAARGRSDGSGLGLAIARENALLHGGTLTAANRPDGGAVMTLRLPA